MRPAAAALVVAGLLTLAACERRQSQDGAEAPPLRLETVEIGDPIDVELTTAYDERARPRGSSLGGALPEDFPSDLPLFSPATVTEFGALGGGERFLELDAPAPEARVRREMAAALAAAGWQGPSGGGREYRKGNRRVILRFEDLAPGTRIRVQYRPRPATG